MNTFEQKQEARRERLEQRAARKRGESAQRFGAARALGDAIPFGQPILVGHHSEKRARRDAEKIHNNMRAGVDAAKEAERLETSAAAVGTGGISSDDPDALVKLDAEIAAAEKKHEQYKAGRKANPDLFPAYVLTNSSARIRGMKKRREELAKKRADVTTERTVNGVRVVDNVEDNRLQLFFDGRPADAVVAALKSHGFRWTPSIGAWQRHRSPGATYVANTFVLPLVEVKA